MWKLYSLRWSVSYGWQWKVERDNMLGTDADYWLEIYRNDEPRVTFMITKAKHKPKLPDMRSDRMRAPTILGR